MSKEGVKDLLEAIEPDYQSEKIKEQKQATIASTLPTDTDKRKSVFSRGFESLKKGKTYVEELGTKGTQAFINKGKRVNSTFKKGVNKFKQWRTEGKERSEKEKQEKTRIFNENRQNFLTNFKRIEELSNNSINTDSFRANIDEILDYAEKLNDFKNRKSKRLRNDTEFDTLVSNISKILMKSKRFFETSIGRQATSLNSQNFNRINELIKDYKAVPEAEEERTATPPPRSPTPPESFPPSPPSPTSPTPPENSPPPINSTSNSNSNTYNNSLNENVSDETKSICNEKLSFFNIKDRRSFLLFTSKYHPDKGSNGIESQINSFVERFPSNRQINSIEDKQSYVFQEISNCADILKIKQVSSGGRRTLKKARKSSS